MECYNFEFPLALLLASAGAYTGVAVGWNPAWFNLDQLSWHSTISVEHDQSLCTFQNYCTLEVSLKVLTLVVV